MAATRARARAEAVRARSSFLKRETELKVEKAQLKAQLQIEEARTEAALATLQQEKEYAAAIAEAKYLESAAADIDEDQRSIDSDVKSIPYECYDKRTIDYVNSQSRMRDTQPSLPQLERFTPPVQSYKGPHTLQHCDEAQQTIDTGDIRPNAALASNNIPANHSTAHGKRQDGARGQVWTGEEKRTGKPEWVQTEGRERALGRGRALGLALKGERTQVGEL
ncbi:hypothetical protein DPEC_G00332320 [Dallia pectoralis]|uniref:Uncharacterized protein n=1 Tax=Dallia pectoralis TaxID=75939 RepID=A0ACC2F628_DALPE|nr:hypothetical protein DPEC_G00332320 [Dallia pectoralis]